MLQLEPLETDCSPELQIVKLKFFYHKQNLKCYLRNQMIYFIAAKWDFFDLDDVAY